MLHPILNMRFKAMLWYQGESNLDGFEGTWAGSRNYACRSRAAVVDWRAKFELPELPFFFVELAACNNYDSAQYTFPILRQATRAVLSLPNTGSITAIDVGIPSGGVHSPVKQPDGQRMGLQLRANVYGENVVADGPVLATPPKASGASVILTFANAANGLHLNAVSGASPLPGFGCAQSPFWFGFSDGSWVRADANRTAIDAAAATVTLGAAPLLDGSNLGARQLTEVRYAWEGFVQCALYSGTAGGWNDTAVGVLPAAPFRSAVSTGCSTATQTACTVSDGVQCCINTDVKPYLLGGEVCTPNGGGCQCKGCVGSKVPFGVA